MTNSSLFLQFDIRVVGSLTNKLIKIWDFILWINSLKIPTSGFLSSFKKYFIKYAQSRVQKCRIYLTKHINFSLITWRTQWQTQHFIFLNKNTKHAQQTSYFSLQVIYFNFISPKKVLNKISQYRWINVLKIRNMTLVKVNILEKCIHIFLVFLLSFFKSTTRLGCN